MKNMLSWSKENYICAFTLTKILLLVYIGKEKEFSSTSANNRKVRARKNCAVVIVFSFSVMKIKIMLRGLL